MLRFIEKYFGLYYLLFFLSFVSIYLLPGITPFVNIVILLFSYQLIVKHERFDVVVVLILYSRCLNGFIIPHDKTAFTVVNVLTNVFPLFLYVFVQLCKKRVKINRDFFTNKYKFTLIFFLLLSLSFFINYSTSYDLITKRYLPFLFFLVFLMFYRSGDFQVYALIRFLRCTFLASILLYFFTPYLGITRTLMESDSIFSVASGPNAYSLVYFSFTRNMGVFFDHRILAIFSYIYLLLAVIYKPKYFRLDIILSALGVITSTSRGGMVTYLLILVVYFFQVYRFKFVVFMALSAVAGVLAVIFVGVFLSPSVLFFLQSFSPGSSYNAINQREFFSNYALEAFSHHPIIGNGVGFLSSHTINRHLIVDGVSVPAVGDAYWYILLAEMGIVGFLLYLLCLLEVFYTNKLLSIALFLGFVLQLLGTDIPDMRFYYFAILVSVYMINTKFKKRTTVLPHA